VLDELQQQTAMVPEGRRVVVEYDSSDPTSNLDDAFGSHLKAAFRVHTGRELDISMSPVANIPASGPSCPSCDPARFVVVNGRVQ
jgi:hypothetical protein